MSSENVICKIVLKWQSILAPQGLLMYITYIYQNKVQTQEQKKKGEDDSFIHAKIFNTIFNC